MSAFIFTNTGGNSIPDQVFRGEVDINDEPVYEAVDRESIVVPPTGQYHLKLTGFSEPKDDEIPERFRKDGGPTTRKITSVELEIASGKGAGRRFFWNYVSFSLGGGDNPSHLLRVYIAGVTKGDKPAKGKQLIFDDLIGAEFNAYVSASETKDDRGRPTFAKVEAKTISVFANADDAGYDPFSEDTTAA